jgi:hypothetical protein
VAGRRAILLDRPNGAVNLHGLEHPGFILPELTSRVWRYNWFRKLQYFISRLDYVNINITDAVHNRAGFNPNWPKLRGLVERSPPMCSSLLSTHAMLRPTLRTQLPAQILSCQLPTRRLLSTTSAAQDPRKANSDNAPAKPHTIDPRWLTMIKRRIGKCMMFGLRPDQIEEGGKILQQLANDWRELLAGSEGFLTDKKRRSLFRHNVVWGEQVWDWCLYMIYI